MNGTRGTRITDRDQPCRGAHLLGAVIFEFYGLYEFSEFTELMRGELHPLIKLQLTKLTWLLRALFLTFHALRR